MYKKTKWLKNVLKIHLGKPSKQKSFNKEIFLKGGRGSIWKPNFFKVKNKEFFARREGVRVKMSLFFTQFQVI